MRRELIGSRVAWTDEGLDGKAQDGQSHPDGKVIQPPEPGRDWSRATFGFDLFLLDFRLQLQFCRDQLTFAPIPRREQRKQAMAATVATPAAYGTPRNPATLTSYTTPSRHRTTIQTPSRTITPSRVPNPLSHLPALSRPLRHTVFARDPLLKQHLLDDLAALDFAIQHQSESVAEAKRKHAAEMAELEEVGRGLESSVVQAGRDAAELVKQLERERSEMEGAKERGRELEERRKAMRTQLEGTKAEVEEWSERVKRKKQEKGGKRGELMAFKGETDREMAWLENFVGLKVRGKTGALALPYYFFLLSLTSRRSTANVLHFKFTYIDSNDYRRPFTLDLDTTSHTYVVPECKPLLRTSLLHDPTLVFRR